MRSGNAGAENQENKETNQETHRIADRHAGLVKGGEQESADHLKDEDHD